MKRLASLFVLTLVLAPSLVPQDFYERRAACMDVCLHERQNPDLQREEVVALERETARAIQLHNTAFFNRVYSEDFTGVLSRGEFVNKTSLLAALQNADISYQSFTATNIKVRLYRDTAVATCVWSMRALLKGQPISSQMLVTHVYLYGPSGYQAVSGQTTLLPPYAAQPL